MLDLDSFPLNSFHDSFFDAAHSFIPVHEAGKRERDSLNTLQEHWCREKDIQETLLLRWRTVLDSSRLPNHIEPTQTERSQPRKVLYLMERSNER